MTRYWRNMPRKTVPATLGLAIALMATATHAQAQSTLLNVSYDPTRELYGEIDRTFPKYYAQHGGKALTVNVSNGGSGSQARSVIDGLAGDVVTLAVAADIDAIANKGLLAKDWQTKFPNNSIPVTSTIVFLVRKGNPKNIHDWGDLVHPGVAIVTPNPKISGGARWSYLAAYGWALRQPNATPATAQDYLRRLYAQVPVLDSASRASTNTFIHGTGDVLLALENEAHLAVDELGADKFDIIYPSISIVAEPPVAVVDSVVDKKGTRAAATAFLNYLYTPEAQEIEAKHFYRPLDKAAFAKYAKNFPNIPTFTIGDFGGWTKVQAEQFADGGVFDQIIKK
jgi:sulfate/thiosulfate-binding protein